MNRFDVYTMIHMLVDVCGVLLTFFGKNTSFTNLSMDLIECCVLCVILIGENSKRVLNCGEVLILGVSSDIGEELNTLNRRISLLDGVLEVKKFEYWIDSPGKLSGLLVIDCKKEWNVDQLRSTIESMCSNSLDKICIEIDMKDSIEWLNCIVCCK